MAKVELQNKNNASGPLYVDTTCIDCETCFHIAPDIFKELGSLSIVQKQPGSLNEWAQAKEAMLSCPTTSIGVHNPPLDFKEAPLTLPRLITDEIYYCGYTSENSYGATSYLIRTAAGNILVDSPRFNSQLVRRIDELGGVKWMFLSHKDDVADHQKFHEHFHCTRIIHHDDLEKDTADSEMILENQESFNLSPEIKIIMTPGHTRGHMVLYYRGKYLFTGDHLFYNGETSRIYASKNVNWYSWSKQIESIKKLVDLNVEWIFPGHGGWANIESGSFRKDLLNILGHVV